MRQLKLTGMSPSNTRVIELIVGVPTQRTCSSADGFS